jgi:hypothetical protein
MRALFSLTLISTSTFLFKKGIEAFNLLNFSLSFPLPFLPYLLTHYLLPTTYYLLLTDPLTH